MELWWLVSMIVLWLGHLRRGATALSTRTTMALSTKNTDQTKLMQDVLYRIRNCNNMPESLETLDFVVDDVHLGIVRPRMAQLLCETRSKDGGPVFELQNHDKVLTLSDWAGSTYESRSQAVAQVTSQLHQMGVVKGWRDELYPVTASFYDQPVFSMERSAVSLLGAIEYGVHMNGIVRPKNDETYLWMARRAADKSKYPGMLDHIAAGGQPVGMSLYDNVIKECLEEAGIPEEITKQSLLAAGAISYQTYRPEKDVVERCVLFCYDLHLPSDFLPTPVDGEVQEFYKYSIDQVLETMDQNCDDCIKPNCYLVVIDFLLRHGYLNPDTPGYLDVLRELRSGQCQ